MLRVEVLSDPGRLSGLEPSWTELADAVDARPFARPSWCLPWWGVLGQDRLSVITVHDGPELVALAPFHTRRRPLMPSVRFLGHGLGAVSGPLMAPDRLDAAARLWDQARHGRQVLHLVECDERNPALEVLRESAPARGCVEVEPRDVCPVVRFGTGFDEFMAGRSGDLRRILRRAASKMDADGVTYRSEVATEESDLRRLMPAIVAVTDAAEEAHPRQHLLAGSLGAFTRALASHAARVGDLALFVGFVDDEPSAFALTLRDGTGIAMWFNRHDPRFAPYSPGHLLLADMARHGCTHQLSHLDLLIGDFRYKRLWAEDRYRTLDVTVAANRSALAIARGQDVATERVRRALADRRGAGDERPQGASV